MLRLFITQLADGILPLYTLHQFPGREILLCQARHELVLSILFYYHTGNQ